MNPSRRIDGFKVFAALLLLLSVAVFAYGFIKGWRQGSLPWQQIQERNK